MLLVRAFSTCGCGGLPPLCDPLSGLRSQADEDDAELSETQTADGQTSNSEGERDSEHGEPAAEANAQSDTKKKKGRASKSAIGKTAKQPPAKESPTRTRVAGKRTIVAPDIQPREAVREARRASATRDEGEEGAGQEARVEVVAS